MSTSERTLVVAYFEHHGEDWTEYEDQYKTITYTGTDEAYEAVVEYVNEWGYERDSFEVQMNPLLSTYSIMEGYEEIDFTGDGKDTADSFIHHFVRDAEELNITNVTIK